MKRFIPLSLAAAVVSAVADQSPNDMEHVIVSVPLHKQAAETALPVTVLSGDELRRMASSTLGETIGSSPGLANASFGPGVGRPVIRGQQGARVMVLQNSTTSADVSGLSADHAVSVEPLLAEDIEILRGPSTLLYGGGAIGGVINVIDNRIPDEVPEETTGGVEYRYVSASELNGGVFKLDGGAGNWAYHLNGLYRDWDDLEIPGRAINGPDEESTDGHIANTDGDTNSLTGGSSFHFKDGFFGLAVNGLENKYGIPPGAHEHGHDEDHEDEHEEEHGDKEEEGEGVTLDIEQTRYDAELQLENRIAALDVLRGYLSYTDYEHKEIESGGEVATRYERDTWSGRLEAVHQPVGGFHGAFGIQGGTDEFSAIGEEAFIPKTDSSNFGIFLVEDREFQGWMLEAGLRYDWTERDPDTSAANKQDFDAYSASISGLWRFAPQWQIGLALSHSERAPANEELYSNVEATSPEEWVVHAATNAIELGDPDLDTEESNNVDISLRWSDDNNFVQLTGFYNDFTDYINLENTGLEEDEVEVYAHVQDDTEFYGAELDSGFYLLSMANGDLRVGIFGDVIYGEFDNGGDVPRLPPARIGSRLSWSAEGWYLWTEVLYAGDQDKPGDFEHESQSYTRWDAGGEYRMPIGGNELVVFAQIDNIGDEEIRLSTSFLRDIAPEAGISAEVGLRFLF